MYTNKYILLRQLLSVRCAVCFCPLKSQYSSLLTLDSLCPNDPILIRLQELLMSRSPRLVGNDFVMVAACVSTLREIADLNIQSLCTTMGVLFNPVLELIVLKNLCSLLYIFHGKLHENCGFHWLLCILIILSLVINYHMTSIMFHTFKSCMTIFIYI